VDTIELRRLIFDATTGKLLREEPSPRAAEIQRR
jgi:hypothetical protein